MREVSIDFDQTPPSLQYATGEEDSAPQDSLVLMVSRNEPEIVTVTGRSRTQDVRWEILVSYEQGGQRHELPIRANGEPFQVMGAPAGVPVWFYLPDNGLRLEKPPADPFGFC